MFLDQQNKATTPFQAAMVARERQAMAPNQPPRKSRSGSSPLQRALQRTSSYNSSIPNAPGTVSGGGRRGVVTGPTDAPGLNARTDASIAARQQRKAATAQRTAANYQGQLAGRAGSLKEAMGYGLDQTNITGPRRQMDDGSSRVVSNAAATRQNMNPDQLAANDAYQGRLANRRENFLAMRSSRREAQQEAMQRPGGANLINSPLMRSLAQRDPQAAMQLAVQLNGQNTSTSLQQALMKQRATDSAADRELRGQEIASTSSLNELKAQALQDSMSPASKQTDLLSQLAPELMRTNPQLGQQLGGSLAESLGITPSELGSLPTPNVLDRESGAVDEAGLASLLERLTLDQDLEGESLLSSLRGQGLADRQIRDYAYANRPGLLGKAATGFANLKDLLLGQKDQARHRMERDYRPINSLLDALRIDGSFDTTWK